MRILDNCEDSNDAHVFVTVTGTLNILPFDEHEAGGGSNWSVKTITVDSGGERACLQILSPQGKMWRELAVMDSVQLCLSGPQRSNIEKRGLTHFSFRAPKVHATLVSHLNDKDMGCGEFVRAPANAGATEMVVERKMEEVGEGRRKTRMKRRKA